MSNLLDEHFDHDGFLLNSMFFAWFAKHRWYRRLTGGIWQRFDGGSPGRPYLFWMRVKRDFDQALETERYS